MTNLNPILAQLEPALNQTPEIIKHIHLIGICGTAMASLAGMLKRQGYEVTGSDQNVYPPMSLFLQELGIPIHQGYQSQNLTPQPDLVIVGNVITRLNLEAIELGNLKIPYLSLPQALRYFAMHKKRSIVITGTHGKTTTTALISWILEKGGLNPSFMVGGIPVNFQQSFKLGQGNYFVIEGDEYDTAFFDKGPKFLHYKPEIVILTSIEFDHADIYRDLEHVLTSFRKLIALIPENGLLIANGDSPLVMAEAQKAKCPVISYGLESKSAWQIRNLEIKDGYTHVEILKQGRFWLNLTTPLYGRHNISNLLSAMALADYLQIDHTLLKMALQDFKGVKRRQEIRGEKQGILVLDDFAHHPTAVRETIRAVRERYPHRRLVAVFEPRSNSSRRNIFQDQYARAFDQADLILIPEPGLMEKIPAAERFSALKLVQDLQQKGLKAFHCANTSQLLDEILNQAQKNDVILVMSNGSFDNLIEKLLNRL
ncbi:MAG: UDP-N-acetylmuramate:L-alanyl-gamma-D-glutamyl-meso-diaminopimelate ligase [Desulfobacteraceae bacterium]|nr:MAG: UDP-N-acetylmuramate:L-alanyl-gamma-D-glutamyl-meso-diaminopimelate ligase [Desulfobacteraceae bacterium]